MRFRLRAIVQSKNTLHDVRNIGRYVHWAGASTIGTLGMFEPLQVDIEGLVKAGDCA